MPQKLGMIHTVTGLVPLFGELCDELLPGIERFIIVDEPVLKTALAIGHLTPALYLRMCSNVVFAAESGADAILVTCSSASPTVDVARKMVEVPVLKVDEPMIDKAISMGDRIGIVATAATTLKPTTELMEERSRLAGREVRIEKVLCEGAYDALFAGDTETHDRIVLGYLKRMMERCDVVVLAQVSMARTAEKIPESERTVPILSSPRLGMEKVREILRGL